MRAVASSRRPRDAMLLSGHTHRHTLSLSALSHLIKEGGREMGGGGAMMEEREDGERESGESRSN